MAFQYDWQTWNCNNKSMGDLNDNQWNFYSDASILTLNKLSCFKDYKKYIHILNPILELA